MATSCNVLPPFGSKFHQRSAGAFKTSKAMSKAAGKGSVPPPPPAGGKAGKAAGKGSQGEKSTTYIKLTVQRLTGEQISVQAELDVLIESVRVSIGSKLGVSPHRVKLLNEGQVLNSNTTVREAGLEDGSVLTTIVLPPVYGALVHAGISAPDEVISAKMELHEALSQAGKLRPVHTPTA